MLVHHYATVFTTSWLHLQVTVDRFVAGSSDPSMFWALRDLAQSTFKILEHTPVSPMGMNRQMHFRLRSDADLERGWEAFAPATMRADLLSDPRMASFSFVGSRPDCNADRLKFKLEPSTKVTPGVFIDINECYQLDSDQETSPEDRLYRMLAALDRWEAFLEFSGQSAEQITAAFRSETE